MLKYLSTSICLLPIVICCQFSFSQIEKTVSTNGQKKPKITFQHFEISIPFRVNETYGDIDDNGNRSDYWFVPAGIAGTFAYGIHYKSMIGLSANTGLVFIGKEKLVAIPIYANIRLSPNVGGDNRLTFQYGVGKSMAIGRGNLSGTYQKFSFGLQNEDDLLLFIAVETHGYRTHNNDNSISTFSLGVALVLF